MAGVDGSVAAEADGVDAAGVNASFDKFCANGLRPTLAKGTIVFVRAAFVTMTLDFYSIRRIGF
jgi:hypothetical protein